MAERLPTRWAYQHGAYYYRPRKDERQLFEDRSWYWLGRSYPDALREFARIKDIEAGQNLSGAIDRYLVEFVAKKRPQTQASYSASLERIRQGFGHYCADQIRPKDVYQYRDALAKKRTMNVANTDLKVLNGLLSACVRWGIVERNTIKGEVAYFGIRDGLKKVRNRYVEDWELIAWQSVASPQQVAFAAIVMLTGARKGDALRIMESHITDSILTILNSKTGEDAHYPLSESLQEAIQQARTAKPRPSLYLFANHRGRCYVGEDGRCESFDRAWRKSMTKAIKETDLEVSFTRHDLRAKVGSDAENERRAQELLGHTDPSMTRRHYRRGKRIIRPVK